MLSESIIIIIKHSASVRHRQEKKQNSERTIQQANKQTKSRSRHYSILQQHAKGY
jgi:hypothetical protein